MKYSVRGIAAFLASTCLLAGIPGVSHSQAYPNKPIRLLVGFAAGGGTDVLARLVAEKLTEKLGQPVIVDNRPGGNTIVATEVVAKAAPDGYTLAMAATPNVTNPSLYSKLPYDTNKDFTWISQLTTSSLVLLANPSVPANSVRELVALAKAQPKVLTYGSAGAGGSVHLAGVLLEKMSNVSMTHVPYKGNGPAMNDLLGGHLKLLVADIPQVATQIQAGKVKPIAVTTLKRSAALPDVPTMAEAGLPGYSVPVWYGVFGPAGMPRDVVAKLSGALRDVIAMPVVRDQLGKWGVEPVGSTPEEFESFVKSESAKWAGVIKEANIRLD